MSHDVEMKPTTVSQFSLATLGGLFAPLLAILLVVGYLVSIQIGQTDADSADVANAAVQARIKPFASSQAIDPKVPHVDRGGEAVYNEVCASCHAAGALGSPKFKDAGAWGKRNAQGWDILLTHATKGFNKMPARGGNPDLTDQEMANAVAYMTNNAGGHFEAVLKKEREVSAAELAQGKGVYAANCASCHDTGMTGAQKLNDVAAWKPLLKRDKEALYEAAIKGSFGGPAKGGNAKLSDAETRLAVDYMVATARTAAGSK
jgi:cytochrome c5